MRKHLQLASAFFCVITSLLGQIPTNGLISKWSFNGNLTQDTQGTYSLTNNSAVLDTGFQQVPNTAAYFIGGANLSVNNTVFRPTTFSMATWFKRDGSVPYHTLACVRINPSSSPFNSYNLCIGNSTLNFLRFFFTTNTNNDVALSDTSFTESNVWTHVAITCNYNGVTTSVKMYVNGFLHAQTSAPGSIVYGTAPPLTLGSVSGAPSGNSLDGSLDEFLFYNRTLSAQEVNDIFNTATTVGLKSNDKINNSQITIYPNPTSSMLNIEVKEQTQISITNILGDDVKTETINGTSKLDVSNLSAGVYFIQDAKSGKAIKFIKE
jgi:hypothetical protein